MTWNNTLNSKLFSSHFIKLKSGIKIGTEITLLNLIDSSNEESNFPHNLISTNTKVFGFRKDFANSYSANTKLSKTQLHKIEQ